jgi:flagellar biosynthesis protein FlhF
MTIKKFQGKTEAEATALAKEEFGAGTVIMNVKEIKPKGFLRSFKSSVFEVTAAIEETEQPQAPVPAAPIPAQAPGNINVAIDEPLAIPKPQEVKEVFASVENTWANSMPQKQEAEQKKENAAERSSSDNLEAKLENLQSLLEKKLSQPLEEKKEEIPKDAPIDENLKFVKMIYSILLENEVDEKYVNQIMDEVEKVMKKGASVDYILSSIYQKMILKFGQPQPIKLSEHKPKVVFFVGPTGVGKTTTIAKIASRFKVEKGKKVALYTADTYRIAAAEQLRTYANILDTPLNIVYSSKELNEELEKAQEEEFELILVDTAGFSHKNEEQQGETKELIDQVPEEFDKDVYLVLSATTKYRDLMEIADVYKENFDFKMIFTKLDETSCYGNILNMKLYTGTDLSYTTYGQNVPEDIEIFNTQNIVKLLLGGK